MRGVLWCIGFVALGLPLALAGLAAGSERLMALGAGLIAAVVVGWPVLLVMGAISEALAGPRRPRRD
ncbi:MAG: hypothetical protein GAK34_03378 [Delftia tsuruhatensis]|nr:MAG: hypothetical protein GAK34_03378 [Delftia tsuruhatensis]